MSFWCDLIIGVSGRLPWKSNSWYNKYFLRKYLYIRSSFYNFRFFISRYVNINLPFPGIKEQKYHEAYTHRSNKIWEIYVTQYLHNIWTCANFSLAPQFFLFIIASLQIGGNPASSRIPVASKFQIEYHNCNAFTFLIFVTL